jgi:hypothetical protein
MEAIVPTSTVRRVIRRYVCVAIVALALVAGPAVSARADDTTTTTTTLPVEDPGAARVIPLPNSGRKPADAGDPGGWGQLLLFGLLLVASACIFGRVLWAGHQRSRANRLP